ncbi:hypothetical protein [Dickeya undicola]|uniref:hypothetical protein n=1 Tax=Dickeya undicola TaxID=1577887 RepID=UPI000532F3D9|nr:hypothetical protein [Dickeya undicola]
MEQDIHAAVRHRQRHRLFPCHRKTIKMRNRRVADGLFQVILGGIDHKPGLQRLNRERRDTGTHTLSLHEFLSDEQFLRQNPRKTRDSGRKTAPPCVKPIMKPG